MKRMTIAMKAVMIAATVACFALPSHAGDNMSVECFVESFKDSYDGYTYRNITNMEKFMAALEDTYTPGKYAAIMDRSRFTALNGETCDDCPGLAATGHIASSSLFRPAIEN